MKILGITFQSKYLFYILIIVSTFFLSIKKELIVTGVIVFIDWILGMINAAKNRQYKSSKVIRKFYISVAYFCGLLISRIVELYWNISDLLIVKTLMSMILLSELQSIREKVIGITGIDLLKFLVKMFEKNGDEKRNNI